MCARTCGLMITIVGNRHGKQNSYSECSYLYSTEP